MDKKTLALVLTGLALRLFLIFPGPLESKVAFFSNPADLRNYYWPAQTALRGENPYALWASGASGEYRADMAPLELVFYVGTVAVWNDPRAIQVLFALFDAANIFLLGILLERSPLRRPFQLFYAFGPLTLYNLVLVPEDKTIVLTLTFLVFYLLLRRGEQVALPWNRPVSAATLAVPVAAVLASFKWLSVFYLLPLLLFVSTDLRAFLRHGLTFVVVVVLSHLPWFPSWAVVYAFRLQRVATPIHISPAVLLNAVGWFDERLLLGVLLASLFGIYALYWRKRIDIAETLALAVAAGILWTPDMDPVHLSIVVLGFLLIVDWTQMGRLLLVWGLSFWVVAVYAISTRAGFTRYGLPDLRQITGLYGSPQMILLSYALVLLVLVFYLADRRRGRAVGTSILVSKSHA